MLKWLVEVWNKKRDMRENPQTVEKYIKWLNSKTPGQIWAPLVGYNALTTCYYTPDGQLVFNPNMGTPLKAFVNQTTGEIRTFDARKFYAR